MNIAPGGGCSRHVALTAPGRSLTSSYEILRHTFSILKEPGASVVIAVRPANLEGAYTSFDMPVFRRSPTSVKRLGLEGLARQERWPLLFHPLKSLRLLFGPRPQAGEVLAQPPAEMLAFCEERGLALTVVLV